jgi:hypothetical protein
MGGSGCRAGLSNMVLRRLKIHQERRAGWHSPSLQRLPERPFRTLPGGSLLKFLCSQFQLSFLAKSRWAPRSSGDFRYEPCLPAEKALNNKKIRRGQAALQACPLNALPGLISCSIMVRRDDNRYFVGNECIILRAEG